MAAVGFRHAHTVARRVLQVRVHRAMTLVERQTYGTAVLSLSYHFRALKTRHVIAIATAVLATGC